MIMAAKGEPLDSVTSKVLHSGFLPSPHKQPLCEGHPLSITLLNAINAFGRISKGLESLFVCLFVF